MKEHDICPWCMTEIVWDEEIGPEKHCPHCENELGGYRTVQIGAESDGIDDSELEDRGGEAEDEWLDDDGSEGSEDARWLEQDGGFRQSKRSWLAVENVLQEIIDQQEEAPECPSCREYMLETGTQTVEVAQFQPAIVPMTGQAVMEAPFRVVWYVCPACYQTSSLLSAADREAMFKRLAPKE